MRILAIADEEESWLADRFRPHSLDDVDLIVSCGDLPARYLSNLADLSNKPLAFVPGNHDAAEAEQGVPGCVDIDGTIRRFHGLHIAGLGGSLAYNDSVYGYTESQMARRASRLAVLICAAGGIDLLVTHVPPRGFGDLEDYAHNGFSCFNKLLEWASAPIMLQAISTAVTAGWRTRSRT